MGTNSSIEWTDTTWQVTNGCTKVSPGCAQCYAETMSRRMAGMARADIKAGRNPGLKANYLNVIDPKSGKWNSQIQLIPSALAEPLSWRTPRRVFVDSMSDLFHEGVPFEFVDKVFAVMALTPQHTFQVLTKRTERMAEYLPGLGSRIYRIVTGWLDDGERGFLGRQWDRVHDLAGVSCSGSIVDFTAWNVPLNNVWLGTSTETQKTADERIPHLLKCPATVRFLSCEPLLGPIDLNLRSILFGNRGGRISINGEIGSLPGIDWTIAGCESIGSRAGRFADGYESAARSLMEQCRDAGTAFFHKQMPINGKVSHDPAEWPEDLRVRQFPAARAQAQEVITQ